LAGRCRCRCRSTSRPHNSTYFVYSIIISHLVLIPQLIMQRTTDVTYTLANCGESRQTEILSLSLNMSGSGYSNYLSSGVLCSEDCPSLSKYSICMLPFMLLHTGGLRKGKICSTCPSPMLKGRSCVSVVSFTSYAKKKSYLCREWWSKQRIGGS
jgi:hypothetical protein